jgi:hypothetical protein
VSRNSKLNIEILFCHHFTKVVAIVGEPRRWKRAQSVLGKGGGERESDLVEQMEFPFCHIKCIKVLRYKFYYFENGEFYFFQRSNFDDETVLIINKPKYPKKGVYKEQNGRTHVPEVK